MSTIRVLSSNGDDAITFEQTAYDEAEALFRRLRSTHVGFRVDADNHTTRLDKFDPLAEEIIMVPKVVGG